MIKKTFFIVITLLAMMIINSSVLLAETKEVTEFGNIICPLSGESIKEGEAIKYEYNGVAYNVCCKMCLKDFKKNPEKYIKKLEAQKEAEEKKEGHGDEHSGHQH